MEALYTELWGNEDAIIKEFCVAVPQAQLGILPAYKISIRQSGSASFSPPEFLSERQKQSFWMLETKKTLPCSTKKFLIRHEYKYLLHLLELVKAGKWPVVPPGDNESAVRSRLDYEISGQPGSGR